MKYYVVISFLFVASTLFGQYEIKINFSTPDQYLFPEEIGFEYILGHDVALRSKPTSESSMKRSLPIATKLKLMAKSDSAEVKKGIKSHWYHVKSGELTGWIWGGLIAQTAFKSTKDPDLIFVGGYASSTARKENGSGGVYYQLRAVKHNNPIDKILIKSFGWDFGGAFNLGSQGLTNVDDIITVHVPCHGGCGCSTGDVIVFWNNNQFYKVAELGGTPDAEYSEGVSFIYPQNMEGVKGQIVKYSSLAGEENESHQLERFIIKEYYIWNGKALVKLKGKKQVKKFKIKNDY